MQVELVSVGPCEMLCRMWTVPFVAVGGFCGHYFDKREARAERTTFGGRDVDSLAILTLWRDVCRLEMLWRMWTVPFVAVGGICGHNFEKREARAERTKFGGRNVDS